MFKKMLVIIIGYFALSVFNYTHAAPCTANAPMSGGYYNLTFSARSLFTNPNSAPPGTVLGNVYLDNFSITCQGDSTTGYEWDFQNQPKGTLLETINGNAVCDIGVQGVGMVWWNVNGKSISCTGWDDIIRIPATTNASTTAVGGTLVGSIVRSSKAFGHYGVYKITVPQTTISLNLAGFQNYGKWGYTNTNGDITFVVSGCSMGTSVKIVDFGNINIDHITSQELSEKNIDLEFTQCGSSDDILTFADFAHLTFSSPTLKSDGTIANENCEGCAKGVYITIEDVNGKMVNLNDEYPLSGNYTNSTDTSFKLPLKANLMKASNDDEIDAGSIKATLVIQVDYF
ncbi:fimbrial protein [Scandinavium goeteborgense]|uniref:fimbrial protein n=1 Tax=Scandinavium goeteborgense TaxID=1851514 RepID=UPI0037F2830E